MIALCDSDDSGVSWSLDFIGWAIHASFELGDLVSSLCTICMVSEPTLLAVLLGNTAASCMFLGGV